MPTTTTILGLPKPALTDPADAAVAVGSLADALEPEAWRTVGAGGQPAYQNSWVAGSIGNGIQFKKHLGVVYLRGLTTHPGASFATVFTLPAGYRPTTWDLSPVGSTAAGPHVFSIGTDGTVSSGATPGTTEMTLDGICFRTD